MNEKLNIQNLIELLAEKHGMSVIRLDMMQPKGSLKIKHKISEN